MRRRNRAEPTGPAAELAGYVAELAAAAARGDTWAADRLPSAVSWRDMLALSGDDPVVADLFLEFVRADRR